MQSVTHSPYLAEKKPLVKAFLNRLLEKYDYASVLLTDSDAKGYSVSRSGASISQMNMFGSKGMVVKVYDGKSYCEYSTNDITEDSLRKAEEDISGRLVKLTDHLPEGVENAAYKMLADEPCTFEKATEYARHPKELGDAGLIALCSDLRQKALSRSDKLVDCVVRVEYQQYHKLFLSRNRDMEQSVLWTVGMMAAAALSGDEVKQYYRPYSGLGGIELADRMEADIPVLVDTTLELLHAEPMQPGLYDCVCDPEVTGMIVHEAFGHGVEMDMFVKDRALAKQYVGKRVASDLVTMHDGNAVNEVATYFFDDEGTLSHDTLIIDHGILKSGISDAQSAMHLGTEPTGNGRRESYERKAYTRMTNTYFEPGLDKVEDMIASISYGMLLENPSSGMEDPKNWGIQCMVNFAREIKDGKLTGRIFSPIVLSGYVPDLLQSISMVSGKIELGGAGACGKGYKEWVKVSDGGPYIKAKIRLG